MPKQFNIAPFKRQFRHFLLIKNSYQPTNFVQFHKCQLVAFITMSTTFRTRYYNEPKQNNLKYNFNGKTKLLLICLNYDGTDSPLTCITDGKRIINEAKKAGVSQITAIFDDGSTELYPNKKNVTKKISEIAASCTLGDILVIYYSGHGTNVPDLDKDEIDGFDQAFCLRSEKGKYQFMTDDQISECMSKNLPDNIPCLFIVDACHSGSIVDLSKSELWNNKKVFCVSGCQDNQYSNDTGDGGQMTNILLAILRQNQYKRKSKQLSIQYIFNRMVVKNQEIQGNYAQEQRQKAYKDLHTRSQNPSFLSMCFSALQLCMGQSNIQQNPNYFEIIDGFVNFDDEPGEHQPVHDKAQPGQWINLSWNGGSDPTKVSFPF